MKFNFQGRKLKYDQNLSEEIAVQHKELQSSVKKLNDQYNVIFEQVMHFSESFYSQMSKNENYQNDLLSEIKKLQSNTSQRALSSLFYKFFKELIAHINHLDEMLFDFSEKTNVDENDRKWYQSIDILRKQFEGILTNWGCDCIVIIVGETEFDPEIHESVENENFKIPENIPEDRIVKVVQRGWKFLDTVLQYPKVIAS